MARVCSTMSCCMLLTHWARPARKGTASIYPMHGFIGIYALDLSRDTLCYLHSFKSSALCDTLVLGCHRVIETNF
jgi:hypothetical protein